MRKNKMKIAVTGGIGSGKSSATKIIAELGYPTASADDVYHEMLEDEDFVRQINEKFGLSEKIENGKLVLDRRALASIAFADENSLKKLNEFTHSKIMAEIERRAANSESAFFAEVPLLFEGGYENFFDRVFVILRREEKRREAVINRDSKTAAEVDKVIKTQFDYRVFERADEREKNGFIAVVRNDGSIGELREKIISELKRLNV